MIFNCYQRFSPLSSHSSHREAIHILAKISNLYERPENG